MPFAFTGQSHSTVAKLGVVSDGDTFTGANTVIVSGAAATLTQASTTTTFTGGAGFVSGDTGKYIYISGAATSANNGWQGPVTYVSASSVTYTNASGATDANNGAISWSLSTLPVSTLSSAPAQYTAFLTPVRSATGVWSVTLKDIAVLVQDVNICTILPTGEYISTQLLPSTVSSTGQLVVNWVFNVAGTPTDLPFPGQFRVYVVYSETRT